MFVIVDRNSRPEFSVYLLLLSSWNISNRKCRWDSSIWRHSIKRKADRATSLVLPVINNRKSCWLLQIHSTESETTSAFIRLTILVHLTPRNAQRYREQHARALPFSVHLGYHLENGGLAVALLGHQSQLSLLETHEPRDALAPAKTYLFL